MMLNSTSVRGNNGGVAVAGEGICAVVHDGGEVVGDPLCGNKGRAHRSNATFHTCKDDDSMGGNTPHVQLYNYYAE